MARKVNTTKGDIESKSASSSLQNSSGSSDHVRVVTLYDDVDSFSISSVITNLIALASINNDPIKLLISTYGGSVHDMFSLYDAMKFVNAPIQTVGLGKVMSAGTLLLAAGKKGHRYIGSSTRVMLHPISGGAFGTLMQMEHEINEMKILQESMIDAYVKETNAPKKKILEIMAKGHDYCISAKEAIDLGLADKLIG